MPALFSDLHLDDSRWLNAAEPLTEEKLRGRALLLAFWSASSTASVQTLEELPRLAREHGPEFQVIAVHTPRMEAEKAEDVVIRAMERAGLGMPVLLDSDQRVAEACGVQLQTPGARVLIGPTGVAAGEYTAAEGVAELKADIADLLSGAEGQLNRLPLYAREQSSLTPPAREQSGLRYPSRLAWDQDRKLLFISDTARHRVLGVTLEGEVRFVIGAADQVGLIDGSTESSRLCRPVGLLCAPDRPGCKDRLFIADSGNHLLRVVDLREKTLRTIAGTGTAGSERDPRGAPALRMPLCGPWALASLPTGEIAMSLSSAHQLWAYEPLKKTVRSIAGGGREAIEDGESYAASLAQPSGLCALEDRLYLIDSSASALRSLEGTTLATLIGQGVGKSGLKDGVRAEALLNQPSGVYADLSGIYVADSWNHALRRFDPHTGVLETIAGSGEAGDTDGPLAQARFREPTDILRVGGKFYICDSGNHRIRVLDPGKMTVTTLELDFGASTQ